MKKKRRTVSPVSSANGSKDLRKAGQDLFRRILRSERLERRDLMAIDGYNPYHNYEMAADVNSDSNISPIDALVVINEINRSGARALSGDDSVNPNTLFDVNKDGVLSPIDALAVINRLNAEGEPTPIVAFSWKVTDTNGNPLVNNVVSPGKRFLLTESAQDLRAAPLGVFSAYQNIVYNNTSLLVPEVGETQLLTFATGTTGGTFRLSFGGKTTSSISFSASTTAMTTNIENALKNLTSIGSTNVRVRNVSISGNNQNYEIIFRRELALTDVAMVEIDTSTLTSTASPAATITERFKANPTDSNAVFRAIDFISPFIDGTRGSLGTSAGTLLTVGAFTRVEPADPTLPSPIATVPFRTISEGDVLFAGEFADPAVGDVSVFGLDRKLTAAEISFSQITVSIVANIKARNDSRTVAEDSGATEINVTANDDVIVGSVKDIVSTSTPSNGTVTISTDKRKVSYRPNDNFFGSDTFTYTISNGLGDTSTATVSITVTEVNDAPILTGDSRTTAEDNALTFAASTLTTNDSPGPANESSQTLTVTAVSATSANGGTVVLNGGNITYTPAANFNGTDTFTVTVSDNGTTNGVSDPKTAVSTVTITVTEVNDPPTAGPDTLTINEDASVIIAGTGSVVNLLANDTKGPANESSQTLSIVSFSSPTPNGGTVTFTGGVATYKPASNFFGTDTVTYTITDNGTTNGVADPKTATGTLTITVNPVNDAPVTVDDEFVVDEQSTGNVLNVLANDNPGPGESAVDKIRIISVSPATLGTISIGPNGSNLIYTPKSDVVIGKETLTYTIRDKDGAADGLTSSGHLVIDIVPLVRPRARNDRATVAENRPGAATSVTVAVLGNDIPNKDATVTLLFFGTASNGIVTLNDNGTAADLTDDRLVYTPNQYFNGQDTFTYTINDTADIGDDSVGTVTVTVTEINDAPTAGNDNVSATEDIPVTFQATALLVNDSPGPQESSQTLSIISATAVSTTGGSVSVQGGNVRYQPSADFNGVFVFSYTIQDNGTTNGVADPKTATAQVTVTVAAVNDDPIIGPDQVTAVEDTTLVIPTTTLLANDKPGPDTATDEKGQVLSVVSVSPKSAQNGVVVLSGGNVSYTPSSQFFGSDSFEYTIWDGAGGTRTGTVAVTVKEVNDAPIVVTDNLIGFKNYPLTYQPLQFTGNDTPGPANESNQTLTLIGVSANANTKGTLKFNNDGTVTYTPPTDYTGPDEFNYRVRDNGTTNGVADPKETVGLAKITVQDFIPSTIAGTVFVDDKVNAKLDDGERRLAGVEVLLTGVALGVPFQDSYITLTDGQYHFEGLAPGSYTITFRVPSMTVDGADIAGKQGDADNLNNQFTLNIEQPGNVQAVDYMFAVNGVNAAYSSIVDQLASSHFGKDPANRFKGMIGVVGPQNARGWVSLLNGYSNIDYAEMALSDSGSLVLSVVNDAHETFTTVVTRGRFIQVPDGNGNNLIRVLGGYSDYNWTKVNNLQAAPPIPTKRYLDDVELIFGQEGW